PGDTLDLNTNSGSALHFTSMTGTIAVTNSTISPNATGLDVNNGTASVSLDAATPITANPGQRSASIQNLPAGAGVIAVAGAITDNGIGILIKTNAGGTITFSGA